jgi:hypothetical protein
MKPRTPLSILAALAGALFLRGRAHQASGGPAWGTGAIGFGRAVGWGGLSGRAAKQHFGRPARVRRPGLISRLFGFFWGLLWICFGLSFAFGGHEYREAAIGFFAGLGTSAARFFTGLFTSASGLIQ